MDKTHPRSLRYSLKETIIWVNTFKFMWSSIRTDISFSTRIKCRTAQANEALSKKTSLFTCGRVCLKLEINLHDGLFKSLGRM